MLGERLKEVRKRCRLTQEQAAEEVHVSKFAISSWEQNKSLPSIDKLTALCTLYDVSADYLLGLADDNSGYEVNHHYIQFNDEEKALLDEFKKYLYHRHEGHL